MDRLLLDEFQIIGYDVLYEAEFAKAGQLLEQANANGERRARSPFPFSDDSNPSFSVNTINGLWRDWHIEKTIGIGGGNFVQFVALMAAKVVDGEVNANYTAAETQLKLDFKVSRIVDVDWLNKCQNAMADPQCHGHKLWMNHRKRWNIDTLIKLGIGYDEETGRIVIPVYDIHGNPINCRMYAPGAMKHKMSWLRSGLSGNFIFPPSARDEDYIILVEGEPDAISLRCLGYNAVSGTLGSGNPLPEAESKWYREKKVYVMMDVDLDGIKAAATCIDLLLGIASEVIRVDIPEWEGRPPNGDVSDWIGFLLDSGLDQDQVVTVISQHIQASQVQNKILNKYEQPSNKVTFNQALSSQNLNVKLGFVAELIANGVARYSAPYDIGMKCKARGHNYCENCAMKYKYNGDFRTKINLRSGLMLKIIRVNEEEQQRAIKKEYDISTLCPDVKFIDHTRIDVDTALLTSTMDEDDGILDDDRMIERPRREAFIISLKGYHLQSGVRYYVEGFVYPAPKTQELLFVLDSARQIGSRYDHMEISHEHITVLEQFCIKTTPFDAMKDVANDISLSSSMIIGRQDLHMMYRTVWYSVISFVFMGQKIDHGWIEALVVGDTRCGKSSTFKSMCKLFGTGELIDCKMQSIPGILGAVETSVTTGQRYVVPGILPRHDRRGPVAFDEFSGSRESRSNMMDAMSSTRAEGKVRITKAASAEIWARVRQIYMANPGQRKLMRDIGGYGVEIISRLIEQPEDIARFDIAMMVSQEDIDVETLNEVRHPIVPNYSYAAHQLLLQWTWSRRPEQIIWTDEAEQACVGLAKVMCAKYDQSIPLVEPSDQRTRIARIAVSIAAQCFSTDQTYQNIIVKPEHVFATSMLFATLYDKPTMNYHRYSIKTRLENKIVNEELITRLLDTRFGIHGVTLAESLLRAEDFTVQAFNIMVPMSSLEVNQTLQLLSANRCIKRVTGRRFNDSYELTRQFIVFLQNYINVRKNENEIENKTDVREDEKE